MASADSTPTDPMCRLYRGLRQRDLVRGDRLGLDALEARLRPTLAAARRTLQPADARPLDGTPPRRIAVAMAMALASHPHLQTTFSADGSASVLLPVEVLHETLGLSAWELDDVREEVDRRAGLWLKQTTLVRWLGGRFDGPALFQQLFPGTDVEGCDVTFHGAHLVCTGDLPSLSVSALHLPWVGEAGRNPTTAFRGRYVDGRLRRDIARGVGLPAEEVDELLESMVCLLPRADRDDLMAGEAWRFRGFAALTGLGAAYPRNRWLCEPADGRGVRWRDWLRVVDGELQTIDAARCFDALLEPRVHGMLVALSTDVLARRVRDGAPRADALDVFDLAFHVDAVALPLLQWARSRAASMEIARHLDVEPAAAEAVLAEVGQVWKQRAAWWARPTNRAFSATPHAAWMRQLLRLDEVVRVIGARPVVGAPHRDLLFLYAGHFLAESPVDRGIVRSTEEGASVGRAVGRWFWPTWLRVLEAMDASAAATDAAFTVPDDLF